ncbi:cyclase family protein [Aeromicrobium sp. CTD01-1L150]|uniref:cyclase family protein n=1 Tax=Aeromicrobium sp. CTD01-1L150 TaxID=3341830 RepID=UPI0035C19E63
MSASPDGHEHTHPLWELQRSLVRDHAFTDLTHAFFPGMPHFPAFPDEEREQHFNVDPHGFAVHRHTIVGQWGTHADPPSHFVDGARSLDEIPVEQMVLPLVVLDISERVRTNPDAVATLDDVAAWERRNGPVPQDAFVALRTDWSHRWPDNDAIANHDADGVAHYPGWSRSVLEDLVERAGIRAIGHETTDTDPGSATSAGDYGLELYLLEQDRWQIELMTNLHLVPEAGGIVVATWPKPRGGSGFPARVFAIHER